jgi:hypothetical protein
VGFERVAEKLSDRSRPRDDIWSGFPEKFDVDVRGRRGTKGLTTIQRKFHNFQLPNVVLPTAKRRSSSQTLGSNLPSGGC